MILVLKGRGITNYLLRREWPVDIVKKIFNELVSETTKDLLAKELWCSSSTMLEWWQKVEVYG